MFALSLASLVTAAGLALSPAVAFADPQATQALAPELQSLLAQVEAFDAASLPPHPRLLLTPPELERVRSAAQSDWGKPLLKAVREHVDAQRSKEIPAEPTGFANGEWNIDDWRRIVDAGGVMQNNILASAFLAALTREPADVVEAKRWALGIAAWNPHGPTGIEGVDHPARDILHALSLSYDWLYDDCTAQERQVLCDCIAKRGRAMYEHLSPFEGDPANNHGWFQASALVEAGLALADDLPEADTWWRHGSRLYFDTFLPLGGRDGDWHEGTQYVSYTLIFVYQWADALRSATGIDPREVPWLQEVGYFRLFIAPPQGAGIHFNDNNVKPPNSWDKMTAYAAARQTQDPVLQWYADTIKVGRWTNPISPLYGLIYRDAALPSMPPTPEMPLGKWYRDSGWVVMRSDLTSSEDVQFGFKGAPYQGTTESRGHDHPDQNGFLLNFLGEPLAVDSGYYDYYGSPHHNNWTFTGRAHNTLLINGREQLVGRDGKILSFISHNDAMDWCEGEAAGAYEEGLLDSWRRQVIYLRPDMFLIRDLVRPAEPADIAWLLHGPKQFAIDGQSFRVRNNKAMLAGSIITPQHLQAEQWEGFPEHAQPERMTPDQYPDQWHLSLATDGDIRDTTYLALLKVGRAPDVSLPAIEHEVHDGVERVTLRDDAGLETRILFNDARNVLKTDGIIFAGRVLATRPDGSRTAMLGVGLTQYAEDQQLLWKSHQPAQISGVRDEQGWQSLNVWLAEADSVLLYAVAKSAGVLVDGKPVDFDHDDQLLSLQLDQGLHAVMIQRPEQSEQVNE